MSPADTVPCASRWTIVCRAGVVLVLIVFVLIVFVLVQERPGDEE